MKDLIQKKLDINTLGNVLKNNFQLNLSLLLLLLLIIIIVVNVIVIIA
jgi:hypothetical protein